MVLAMAVLTLGHAQPAVQRQLDDSVHAELDCSACHPKGTEPQQTGTVGIDDRACADCHESAEPYWKSAHGRAQSAGVAAAPTCVDCHGSHAIEPVSAKTSPVYPTNLPKTCGQCHQNSELSQRYGVPSRRYSTYMESYHGILLSEGKLVAADCTSCHGDHLILAQSNPKSTINPANLPETCGQCHPNAGETFTKGDVHVQAERGESTGVWIVRTFYTVLIGVLGVFFIGHILLDATRWLRRRYGN
ncbi:MAG: cytochrome c3 family protein [Candidatus Bipolaricaulia bacterium]